MNYNLDETNMRFAEQHDVAAVLEHTKHIRSLHRTDKNGYSKDHKWRDLGDIPASIFWSRWFQERFPAWMPAEERTREMRKFFTQNPKLLKIDKV